jgi:hypothetical protein
LRVRSGHQIGGQEHVSGVGRYPIAVVDETKPAPASRRQPGFLLQFTPGGGQHIWIRLL